MEIITQKLITSPFEILEADIIDFNRLNGVWNNSGDALKTIFSWFDHSATITKVRIPDFHEAPVRDDWPGWDHIGHHAEIGQAYWNWFHLHKKGTLNFSDAPDFYGVFEGGGMFWGDVGKVSASTFAMTQKGMSAGDLWISLLEDGNLQVIIECHINIVEIAVPLSG